LFQPPSFTDAFFDEQMNWSISSWQSSRKFLRRRHNPSGGRPLNCTVGSDFRIGSFATEPAGAYADQCLLFTAADQIADKPQNDEKGQGPTSPSHSGWGLDDVGFLADLHWKQMTMRDYGPMIQSPLMHVSVHEHIKRLIKTD
jgi:hypothetical protein